MGRTRKKVSLPNVTLVALTSVRIKETVKALMYSMKGIDFGDVVFISHQKPVGLPKEIRYEYIEEISCIDDFNYAMVYDLYKYINTDYILLVHYDGFVVNPDMWRNEFLEYDYIGAPWPIPKDNEFRDINGNVCRVGNSVSIRSKRLLELPSKINLEWEPQIADDGTLLYHEDGYICCAKKHVFEHYGMKFAPLDVAKYFSHETMIPETEGIKPFVFHKWAGTNAQYPNYTKRINVRRVVAKIKTLIC